MIGASNGYKEQYERMKRWQKKLYDYSVPQREYEDCMWAFFQAAFHLKDWIKYDIISLEQDVESHIKSSNYLKIVADLANRSKHMALNRKPRVDADIKRNSATVMIQPIALQISMGGDPIKTQPPEIPAGHYFEYYVEIPNDTKIYNHIELAELVVKEWDDYIKLKGI